MYACETVQTTFVDETEILSVSLAATFRFSSQTVMTGIILACRAHCKNF